MFCCLTADTAKALLCMANAEFGIQMMVEADPSNYTSRPWWRVEDMQAVM